MHSDQVILVPTSSRALLLLPQPRRLTMHRPHLLILLLALLITLVVADMTDEEREIEEARIRAEKDRDLDRTPPQSGSGPSSIRDLNACYLVSWSLLEGGIVLTRRVDESGDVHEWVLPHEPDHQGPSTWLV